MNAELDGRGVQVAGNEVAHAHPGGQEVEHGQHGGEHHDEVYAPDQLAPPPFRRLTLLAAFITIAALPLMAFVGNHEGNVEKVFLVGIAALILLWIIVDWVLRRRGLRG